ncbi:MAG: hypothetical protein HYX64_08085 [Gammaproteobacteria bacterium]|nr:hypothetical protein [Gammaproteobacteria bacterium]
MKTQRRRYVMLKDLTPMFSRRCCLLDATFPEAFARLLLGHDISTVHSLGWFGIKNSELLRNIFCVT